MNKKSVSATILILFLALFFSVVGICFSCFVYKNSRTLVKAVKLKTSNGINIFEDEQQSSVIYSLKLSNMDTGLKPVTGDIDAETQIPTTIDDQGTSEGYYSTVYVKSDTGFKILIDEIDIQSNHSAEMIEKEKKNIFVGILDVNGSVRTFENNGAELARFNEPVNAQKLTFLIWLGSLASDELEGANIYFTLNFVNI